MPAYLGKHARTAFGGVLMSTCMVLFSSLLKTLAFVFILKAAKFKVPTYVHKEHLKELLWFAIKQ